MAPTEYNCSFCHRLYSSSSTSPAMLGNRHVCSPCQGTLLNLSICWSCHTLLYRAADSVSFGWTFWCRTCFGCIFCHAPLRLPANNCLATMPVCRRCRAERGSTPSSAPIPPDAAVSFVDLDKPLTAPSWSPTDTLKPVPACMRPAPTQRDAQVSKPAYYPYFQNPRRSLVPSIDSSFASPTGYTRPTTPSLPAPPRNLSRGERNLTPSLASSRRLPRGFQLVDGADADSDGYGSLLRRVQRTVEHFEGYKAGRRKLPTRRARLQIG
jgi:hypothetical protein